MKERYIQMRNQNVVDWPFIYDYVVSKGFNLGVNAFNYGAQYLLMEINFILDFLDHEYELTILLDKQGKFIKVIT
jgi:hypothetical protein